MTRRAAALATAMSATAMSVFGAIGVYAEPLRVMPVPPGALPAFEAVTITRSMGLDPVDGPVWRDGRYMLRAIDPDGREMHVVLDGRDGHVLAVRPQARRYFAPGGYGPRDDVGRGYEMIEEADVPYARLPAYERYRVAPPLPQAEPARRHAAPVKQKPTPKPQQSAKAAPLPPQPPQAKSQAKSQTKPAQQTASSPQATAGSEAASGKKEIRKIELYRTPAEPAAAKSDTSGSDNTSGEQPAEFPLNPLL